MHSENYIVKIKQNKATMDEKLNILHTMHTIWDIMPKMVACHT